MSLQTQDLSLAVPWTSQSTKLNILARYTSNQGARDNGQGPALGFQGEKKTKQKKTPQLSRAVPRAVPWTSQSTELNHGQVSTIPR